MEACVLVSRATPQACGKSRCVVWRLGERTMTGQLEVGGFKEMGDRPTHLGYSLPFGSRGVWMVVK